MPPKKGGKKKGDEPERPTRCPMSKDGKTCLYEWQLPPKMYVCASITPESKAVRKIKDTIAEMEAHNEEADGPWKGGTPLEAMQYAVARGNIAAVNTLLAAGVDVQTYTYEPPLTEEQLAYLWKDREAKKAQAAEEAAAAKKKKK